VFFREQTLTPDQHKDFARQFAKIYIHPSVKGNVPGHPEIMEMRADENSKKGAVAEVWHSDSTADVNPPWGSLLFMHEVPSNGGGDTLFANMYAAYEALSEPVKRMLEGLQAVHDSQHLYKGNPNAAAIQRERPPSTEHPIVKTHPETGRKLLFVNAVYCSHIVGVSELESATLLDMLYRHIENPMFHCRFKWRPGSIAFWDNRACQHRAIWDFYPLRRRAQRVTICDDPPM
ncbi:MAG: TauD/TfdA family dioxygenase, partial [Steroidobacteraceae bacterium]